MLMVERVATHEEINRGPPPDGTMLLDMARRHALTGATESRGVREDMEQERIVGRVRAASAASFASTIIETY